MSDHWISLLGVDPGLAHLGYGIVILERDQAPRIARTRTGEPIMGLLATEKSAAKQNVGASDDNLRRARELVPTLMDLIHETPDGVRKTFIDFEGSLRIRAICVEAMSYPRSSTVSCKMGMSWGVLACLSEIFALPIVQASPQMIKKAVCGKKDASKPEIQLAVSRLYSIPPDLFNATTREHPYDAVAVVHALLDTEVVRMARRFVAH